MLQMAKTLALAAKGGKAQRRLPATMLCPVGGTPYGLQCSRQQLLESL